MTTPLAHAKPPRLSRVRVWTVLFLIYSAILVVEFEYRYLDDLSRQHAGTFGRRLLEEATGVYSVFFLLPFVVLFARYYLFECQGWARRIALHLSGAVLFSFLHTTMMALSRRVLAPALGLGEYDYGILRFESKFPDGNSRGNGETHGYDRKRARGFAGSFGRYPRRGSSNDQFNGIPHSRRIRHTKSDDGRARL